MSIKVNNTVVIDDNRNFIIKDIQFSDSTTQSTASGTETKGLILRSVAGSLVHTIKNPNAYSTSYDDNFGRSVDISGNYAIVGSRDEDDAGGLASGIAYIFNVTTGALVHILKNPTYYSISANDRFGQDVAISGNYAIVSAPYEKNLEGAAYIFNVTTGALVHTLNNPNAYSTSAGDEFGFSVDISGNYAIVGAIGEDDPLSAGYASGKAYIFNVTTGQLVHTLNNPNAYIVLGSDLFGSRVKIKGKYAIVGSEESDSSGVSSGCVYVFNVNTGALLYTLNNPNVYSTGTGDFFGYDSIDAYGEKLIVGAWGENDASGNDSGKAYIFNLATGALLYTLNNPNLYGTGLYDSFGFGVALTSKYAIVTSYEYDGVAFVYDVNTGALLYILNNPNAYSTTFQDSFGSAGVYISATDNYLIISAPGEDEPGGNFWSGVAYIFSLENVYDFYDVEKIILNNGYEISSNNALFQTSTVYDFKETYLAKIIDNPNVFNASSTDFFGASLSISGTRVVIGVPQQDGEYYNNNAGVVYVANTVTGALIYTLTNPYNYGFDGSYLSNNFGISVDISGNYIVVGAISFLSGGKAFVYNAITGALVHILNNPNAFNTVADDYFGGAVAISGSVVVVGARQEDDAGGSSSGKAYVFDLVTGGLLYTLNNPNYFSTSAGDAFGWRVSASQNYIAVSAPIEDLASNTDSGRVYVYDTLTGTLLYALNNPNAYSTSAGDVFGRSLDITENYIVVGAPEEDDAGVGGGSGVVSGKAYIFNSANGALLWTLNNPNSYANSAVDYFGTSVSVFGNHVIVGAPGNADNSGSSSGTAYLYTANNGTLVQTINNPNAYSTGTGDYFGGAVAIANNIISVSANLEDSVNGIDYGTVYNFNYGGTLVSISNNFNTLTVPGSGESDYFGGFCAINERYAIVGAEGEGDSSGKSSGKVYVFDVNSGRLLNTINNPNAYSTGAGDEFGRYGTASSLYEKKLIVPAYAEDDASGTNSGKVYVFDVDSGTLLFTLNNPNAYSTSDGDQFGGMSSGLSIFGNYIAVSAREDDTLGNDSGKVYVFSANNGTLLYTLNNPNAYGTIANDYFGGSLCLTEKYLAVGAVFEDDASGTDSGKVYVFDVNTGTLLNTINNPNAYSTSLNDYFGNTLTAYGNYLLTSADNEDEFAGQTSGVAYLFDMRTGNLIHTFRNPNSFSTPVSDYFGFPLAIHGNYCAICTWYEEEQSPTSNILNGEQSGKVYIFDIITGQLVKTLSNPNPVYTPEDDLFPSSIAMYGRNILAGTYLELGIDGPYSGKAYIFKAGEFTRPLIDKVLELIPNS